jgi:teichuronic acid biosynthesis glycosyltransferase TuaG
LTTVTVVMAAYNAESTIERALQSVAAQDTKIDEIVCVDDGSKDGTFSILASWEKQLPLKVLRNTSNEGLNASLIKGVSAASSSWIFRLDADDRWRPTHVSTLLALTEQSNVVLVTSPACVLTACGKVKFVSKPLKDSTIRRELMWDCPLYHSASGFSKESYYKVGGYSPTVHCQDYDLWIRLLSSGALGASEHPTIDYFVLENSLSRQGIRAKSIYHRWQCQKRAIREFHSRHRLAALSCLALGGVRGAIASCTLATNSIRRTALQPRQ